MLLVLLDDVLNSMLSVADLNKKQGKSSTSGLRAFNVATGKATKTKDIAELVIKIFGLDLEPIFAESRQGDIIKSLADITRLKTELGFVLTHEIGLSLKQLLTP